MCTYTAQMQMVSPRPVALTPFTRRVGAHRCHIEIAILRTEPGGKCGVVPVGHDAPVCPSAVVARSDPSMGGPAGDRSVWGLLSVFPPESEDHPTRAPARPGLFLKHFMSQSVCMGRWSGARVAGKGGPFVQCSELRE